MLSPPASAVRVDGLFEAEVEAAGRDSGARDAALARALETVLARLTGGRTSLQSAAAADLLESPGRYVEQYRYREVAREDGEQERLLLWAQFDGVSLARDIRRAGLPYWGAERPDMLAWLAVDERGRRYLVAESGGEVAELVRRAARRHGLPLALPLMDVEDRRAVEFTDVWGGFSDRIQAASQRYRPQALLSARLERRAGGDWRADWQLVNGANRLAWSAHAQTLDALLDAGAAEAAARLAQRYAVVSTASGMRTLVVEGVQSLDDYARVSAYLAGLSPVDRVDVLRVAPGTVEFNLLLSADERSLRQLIALGRVLRQSEDPAVWRFRLQP